MAPDSSEGSLARAVLDHVRDCLARDDLDRLAALGLRREDVDGLRALPQAALDRLARLVWRGIRLQVNGGDLRRGIDAVQKSLLGETVQRDLIRAGAPRAMMTVLFGMGSREFRRIRADLGVKTGVGRPRTLGEDNEMALWLAMVPYMRQGRALSPEDYLELQAETRIPVRNIWRFVHEQSYAAAPDRSGGHGPDGAA